MAQQDDSASEKAKLGPEPGGIPPQLESACVVSVLSSVLLSAACEFAFGGVLPRVLLELVLLLERAHLHLGFRHLALVRLRHTGRLALLLLGRETARGD